MPPAHFSPLPSQGASQPPPATLASQPQPTASQRRRAQAQALSPAQKEILLRHRLSQPTVLALLALPVAPPPDEILAAASRATELTSFPLRPPERALMSHISGNGSVLWPLAVSHPTQTWEKAFLIAQATASGEEWAYAPRIVAPARAVLLGERRRIVTVVVRALRCAAELMGLRRDAVGLRRALELARCITAGAWEGNQGRELLQVPNVGPKKMETLRKAGVSTVRKLARMEFYHIERVLKRNPPFGQAIAVKLEGFPRTGMRARVERWATDDDAEAVRKLEGFVSRPTGERKLAIIRVEAWVENEQAPRWRDQTPWVCMAAERGVQLTGDHVADTQRGRRDPGSQPNTMSQNRDGAGELLFFWRGSTKTLIGEGRTTLFAAALVPNEPVSLWMSCEEIVGTLIETVVTAPAE